MEYLKKIAKIILKKEFSEIVKEKETIYDQLQDIAKSKQKLEKKIKRLENPENILLKYYRIDNISPDGMPPSYLNPLDTNEYILRIHELEGIYRNKPFRELMAWSLNFHANLCAVGKIRNEMGDEIEISASKAQDMISGIKAIWELVVAAHNKDQELNAKEIDPYDVTDIIE